MNMCQFDFKSHKVRKYVGYVKELEVYSVTVPCLAACTHQNKLVLATNNFQQRSTWTASAPV